MPLAATTVSAVGCGDVSLGIAAARGVHHSEVERALHQALSLGVTLVEIHDEDDAERLVGEAIRTLRLRDRTVVATRVPPLLMRAGVAIPDVLVERLAASYVQERVESSLRLTRLDAIPLVQLPFRDAWHGTRSWFELVDTCERLVREGKVMAWGALLDRIEPPPPLDPRRDRDEPIPPPPLSPYVSEPWLSSIQVPYNLCERQAEALIAKAAELKKTVFARRPLAGGTLAGHVGPGMKRTPRDDRNDIDLPRLEHIALHMARLAPLLHTTPEAARSTADARAILERGKRPDQLECTTIAELALRFVIDRGTVALPRIHRHEHVMSAILAASAPPLSPDLLLRILDEKPAEQR